MDAAQEAESEREPTGRRKLLRDPRVLAVVVLLLGAILVGGVVVAVATFTTSSTNNSKIVVGDLTFLVSPTGTIVDTAALRPGLTKTGQATITNQKAAATFTLGFTGIGTSTLASTLQLTVTEVSPTARQLYSGVLSAVPSLTLERLATNASMQLSFTFSWPAANQDPALQGQTVPLVLEWSAAT